MSDAISEWSRARKAGKTSFVAEHKPSWIKDNWGKLLILILSLLFFAGVIYWINNKDKGFVEVDTSPEYEVIYDHEENIEPTWQATQDKAIEQIRAWERVQRYLIDQFFSTPFRGDEQRKLCITQGNKRNCKTLEAPLDFSHN